MTPCNMTIEDFIDELEKYQDILSEEDYKGIKKILEKYQDNEPKLSFEEELKNIEEAENLKQEGTTLFKKGDFQGAIDKYTSAIEKDPKNKLLYSNRSACHAKLQNTEEGIKDAKKSIQIDPHFAKGYSRLGNFYLDLDPEKSLEYFEKALENDPSNQDYKTIVAQLRKKTTTQTTKKPAKPGDWNSQMKEFMSNPETMKMAQDFIKNKSPEELEQLRKQMEHLGKK